MQSWDLLGRIVVLLAAALAGGLLARRLRQNPVVGYLAAGVLLGPSALGWFRDADAIRALSELGVSLLLFSIGLEFSLSRLRQIGRVATLGGVFQVLVTGMLIGGAFAWAGSPLIEAVVVGGAVAMSSTAVVLRVLADRVELDSRHGRNAIGILLLQDLAVVPLLVLVETLAERAGGSAALQALAARLLLGVGLLAVLWMLARWVMPGTLLRAAASGSRELPVVLAVVASLGSAWGAHALGLSPALGAFVAGLLLAESPFSEQVRADITPLGAVFITIFFSSIGTAAELSLGVGLLVVVAAALGVMAAKATVVAALVWLFQGSLRVALATGLALSQVGEFTFVLADLGHRAGVVSDGVFQLLVGVAVTTLILTPYVAGLGPRLFALLTRPLSRRQRQFVEEPAAEPAEARVVLVGFGPAGQEVARFLDSERTPFVAVDLDPHLVAAHRGSAPIEFGDATRTEILHHLGVPCAPVVVVTVSYPEAARLVIAQVRRLAPEVPIVARCRYRAFAALLQEAGATVVVDEERLAGEEVSRRLLEFLFQATD